MNNEHNNVEHFGWLTFRILTQPQEDALLRIETVSQFDPKQSLNLLVQRTQVLGWALAHRLVMQNVHKLTK